MQENKSWQSLGSYAGLKFDQHCFDAILSLAIALNKTVEGICNTCAVLLCYITVLLTKLSIIIPLDLSTDEMFSDIAKQQAGIQTRDEMDFQITNFRYNISIIPNRTKLHLGNVCFNGLSVHKDYTTMHLVQREISIPRTGSSSI